jgi:hypothetical protein
MNKRFLFLAFAAFAVFSCSDDKSPSREEICKKDPVEKDCLVGQWLFTGVYQNDNDPSYDCPEPGILILKADGDYSFTGGVGFQDRYDIGTWVLKGNTITATSLELGDKTGTIKVTNSGAKMDINTEGQYSFFADCSTDKLEKFSWQGK